MNVNNKNNTPFKAEDVNWEELAGIGILKDELEMSGELDTLLKGEKTGVMSLSLVLLGVDVERTKRRAIVVCALAVGAVTATTGAIGFIGLIAPHWVRMVAGPDHRIVLPGSALLGAALVLAADAVARTAVKPAELPLGVLTAFIGVPMFLFMLRHFRGRV